MLPPVDLVAAPGRVVLIDGPSGAGKSSLVAALLGFAEYDGAIEIDGVAAADARGAIAWAGQRPGLVAGSVAQNVALGDPAPDAAVVRASLADAQADDVDPDLELGSQGGGLSGGQAQRVAVARALYRLRRTRGVGVLVLDEPSSALDSGTETALWTRLRSLADDGTAVVLVSHRTSARRIADDVVTLTAPLPAASTAPLPRSGSTTAPEAPERGTSPTEVRS